MPTPTTEVPENPFDQLKRIDPSTLHDATDRLNKTFSSFERALNALNLGIKAEVVLSEEDEFQQVLVFRKSGSSFKLFVERTGEKHESESPLNAASRDTRLRAAWVLPELVGALLQAYNDEMTRVQRAIVHVETVTETVRSKKPLSAPFGEYESDSP